MNSAVNAPDRVNGPYAAQRGRSRTSSVSSGPVAPAAAADPAADSGDGPTTGGRCSSSPRSARARTLPTPSMANGSLRRSVVPVPISTLASRKARCHRSDVTSTVRTRSSGVTIVCRRSSPLRSCSCDAVIR